MRSTHVPLETLIAHPPIRALVVFLATNPTPPEIYDFADRLSQKHPDHEWALRLFVMAALCPGQLNELVLDGCLTIYQGEEPVDPRRVVGSKLTFCDLKEGRADIFDIARHLDDLDRAQAQEAARDRARYTKQSKDSVSGKAEAIRRAEERINKDNDSGVTPLHRREGKIILTHLAHEIGPVPGLGFASVVEAIRPWVRDWEARHPYR